ncbi:hypothetical protein [Nonlabens ponticola]|uniref:Lipocalin-like domain-containing protein n=1 Tax=Nonlabens ponticola TaxID=2496866 RepID=A0A3S9MW19_9FLAO|nr:hypothetical protein [Nonlabens ponticola]AZQ43415.1 hypothetical protein EJ995_03885 [Nonlabens ponticola]
MKKITLLSFAIMSLFLFSCTEEDDDNGTTDPNELTMANFVGTYDVIAVNTSGSETDTFDGMTRTETFTQVGSDFNNVTFTFTDNGRVSTTGSFTTTTDYKDEGFEYTEVETNTLDLDGRYSLDGNSLILSENDGAITTIDNFSSEGFDLLFEINDIEDDYSFQAQGTYTLVRQ